MSEEDNIHVHRYQNFIFTTFIIILETRNSNVD